MAAAASASAAEPDKSWTIPALEIVAFACLLNRHNRRFSGSTDYDVTATSIRRSRSASYPTAGERRQTLSLVGIDNTLLSDDGFGVPDWGPGAN